MRHRNKMLDLMKRMFYVIVATLIAVSASFKAKADEGMWLPLLLNDYNYEEMKRLGLKLTPEQIYSINTSSVKDAIVQLGGFCTAEVVSDQGLLFTNHHCAYDAIQEHSTVEHNYLKNGFWAMSKDAELNVPGLTVTFLVRVEDVTSQVMKAKKDDPESVREAISGLTDKATEGTGYRAEVKSMFDGNGYYLFVYETFRDIRLVGAPPSSIGKFGGDTDNWMWPRHTGDFSMLRIYSNTENEPADYSVDNVPYVPKHSLPVSVKGVKDGDFTMIMGYPGSTDRYFTSYEVTEQQEILGPAIVKIMGERLSLMKEEMDKDEAVKIKLASNYASLNNTYKYFQGNIRSLEKFNLAAEKAKEEKAFQKWVKKDKDRTAEYGTVLNDIESAVKKRSYPSKYNYVYNMAGFAPAFVNRGFSMYRLHAMWSRDVKAGPNEDMIKGNLEGLGESFKEYDLNTDRKILAMAIRMLYELPADKRPDLFNSKLWTKAKGANMKERSMAYATAVLKKSMLGDEAKMKKFLEKPKFKKLDKDPLVNYIRSVVTAYRTYVIAEMGDANDVVDESRELYFKGIMEMNPDKHFYPDANFTMRLTYGQVMNYKSWEGKPYATQTWAQGILKKEIPNDDEFHVEPKLKQLIQDGDFGPYAEDGKLPVCFLHNTDITGGNSGSPVINGNGELIGIAFDGNWESMMSDLKWQDEYVRTISVDIRYVLFVIDKYAGAGHLIDEMTLVK